jgi:hypothetical protein|tara:strand:+ start:210 stop:488 length:279 start_codon:yes stop_codon:yes gene_type:complete
MRSCLLKNVNCLRGGDIKTKEFEKMNLKTKIKSDTAPLLFFTMIDCQTFGELQEYLTKRNLTWNWAYQSNKENTIVFTYKNNKILHDFEIIE